MVVFEDIEDVREWLEPLDYIAFWEAVGPHRLTLQDRDFCDGQIMRGEVSQELVLDCLKGMARIELTAMFGLRHRIVRPAVARYPRSVH